LKETPRRTKQCAGKLPLFGAGKKSGIGDAQFAPSEQSLKKRVWMEGRRQRRLGSQATHYKKKEERRKTDLTHTGLLMEGL